MTIHTGRLVFTPADPFHLPPDIPAIIERLRRIEFCAEPVSGLNGHHYLLGRRFMQLVSFMGCSPFIHLQPTEDDQPFCHLIVDGPYPEPSSCKAAIPPRRVASSAVNAFPTGSL
jgi:hypothetical protein